MTIGEFLSTCQNIRNYAVKVTTNSLNFDLFVGDVGEPVPERVLDREIARWYLPECEGDTIEIYT